MNPYTYIPLATGLGLAATFFVSAHPLFTSLEVVALVLGVMASVHHAEVIAHKLGEPLGTLVLALAVTVIEVSLILTLMFSGGPDSAALARDTIFAAVMIICNGVLGLCLLYGGLHHKEQSFKIEGTGSGFAALVTLATLVLVMPTLTVSSSVGTYTDSQLVFVALSSITLWLVFVFIQTIRHRDYFLPDAAMGDESVHAEPPSNKEAWFSLVLMLVSLVCVVGFAKKLSTPVELLVHDVGAPKAVVGIIVAMIVLMPEMLASMRAARANRLQTSMNLAFGSALATIGLTIPLVVACSVVFKMPLTLGLAPPEIAMLFLTFMVGTITLGSGRTNVMQGAIHLVLFAAVLVLTMVP